MKAQKMSRVEKDQLIIDDFIKKIEDLPQTEFFSFYEIYEVKEVKDIIRPMINMELGDLIAYDNIPTLGFRYVYFNGPFSEKMKPEAPLVSHPQLEKSLKAKGYVMAADDHLLFVGLPESHFDYPYVSKFDNLMEDRFC